MEYKVGVDLYPAIAIIQIFLTVYLIFFYTLMVQSSETSLQDTIKYFQFSGSMVLAVLAHVASIVIERRITLMTAGGGKKELTKYIYTMVILALVLIFIYAIAPLNAVPQTKIYQPRGALIAFSFFWPLSLHLCENRWG